MQTHYLEENGNVKEVDQYQNKMKKSQLRNIIRKSIKQLIGEHIHPTLGNYDHHIDPNNPSATIASLYGGPPPLYGDGTHVYHYKGNICPAKFAMHYTGLPISDVQNFHWLNQQYATIPGMQPLNPSPNPPQLNTQMFDCFQVHPVAESWYANYMQPINPNGAPQLGGNPGSFADLPQIMGQYSAIQQGLANGWLYVGGISTCNDECAQLAVNYEDCQPPPGGCPPIQTPAGPVQSIWQPYPNCQCLSPSVDPNTNSDIPLELDDDDLVSIGTFDEKLDCQCCDEGYPISMTPIPANTPGGCSSWNGSGFSNCADAANFDPKECEREAEVINCTCCDDLNPGTGLSPTPPILASNPAGCSSFNGPYGNTVLSGCAESSVWNVNNCVSMNPCDSWTDPFGDCCDFCDSIGWPAAAPTNVSCGGTGTGGNPSGANNWFCECCPGSIIEPTFAKDFERERMPKDFERERMQKLAGIPRREL